MIPENDLYEDLELSFNEKYFPFIDDIYPEQILRNSAFLIAAAVATIFASPLAYVFAIAVSSQLLTFSLLLMCSPNDEHLVSQVQLKILTFQENYSFVQIVAFLVMIAVFFIFPFLSGVLAGLLGIYVSLISDATYYKRLQTIEVDFLV
ncbi:MAG: hypothetical protein H0T62_08280 [Parachlamydiaceae bacterium]|nr:hypothetical protein [Parachlamydiaceae bacterium]